MVKSIRKRLNLSCLYWSVWQSVTGKEKGLWGSEVINEPVTENMWETMKVPEEITISI